jgi:hypothetical protein
MLDGQPEAEPVPRVVISLPALPKMRAGKLLPPTEKWLPSSGTALL